VGPAGRKALAMTKSDTEPATPIAKLADRRHFDCKDFCALCISELQPHLGGYTLSPAVATIIQRWIARGWDAGRASVEVPPVPEDG